MRDEPGQVISHGFADEDEGMWLGFTTNFVLDIGQSWLEEGINIEGPIDPT
jgi:hypothetical protein